jgi:DNA mismatch repair protein MSH6
MGGKSCTTRAVALATLLAHAGSHVPAAAAALTPVDAVFTRMGASDSLLLARSTFLEEMTETADILRQATRRSLVIFDELGRGTSTADGAAIAAAVLDFLAGTVACRSLFITHFHRVARDDGVPAGAAVAHMAADVAVDDAGVETVTFRYKLAPGACPRSYGVNVARLAGLPPAVVGRAAGLSADLADGRGLGVGGGVGDNVAVAVAAAVSAARGEGGLDEAVEQAAGVVAE